MLPLFVFMWWEDFQNISRMCVGGEVEGLDDNSTMRGIMKRSVK